MAVLEEIKDDAPLVETEPPASVSPTPDPDPGAPASSTTAEIKAPDVIPSQEVLDKTGEKVRVAKEKKDAGDQAFKTGNTAAGEFTPFFSFVRVAAESTGLHPFLIALMSYHEVSCPLTIQFVT